MDGSPADPRPQLPLDHRNRQGHGDRHQRQCRREQQQNRQVNPHEQEIAEQQGPFLQLDLDRQRGEGGAVDQIANAVAAGAGVAEAEQVAMNRRRHPPLTACREPAGGDAAAIARQAHQGLQANGAAQEQSELGSHRQGAEAAAQWSQGARQRHCHRLAAAAEQACRLEDHCKGEALTQGQHQGAGQISGQQRPLLARGVLNQAGKSPAGKVGADPAQEAMEQPSRGGTNALSVCRLIRHRGRPKSDRQQMRCCYQKYQLRCIRRPGSPARRRKVVRRPGCCGP